MHRESCLKGSSQHWTDGNFECREKHTSKKAAVCVGNRALRYNISVLPILR
jgi:hypothetical protein